MDPHLLTRLGIAVAAQRRYTEAMNHYQHALQIDHNHQEAWAQLGITFFLHNDLGSARDALQSAIALNPDDTNALRHLALVDLSLRTYAGRIAHFERLLALAPDDYGSRLDLAVIFLSINRGEIALQHLDQIAEEQRHSSKFLFYQAMALQQTGHPQAAQELLQRLVDNHGDSYAEKARSMLFSS